MSGTVTCSRCRRTAAAIERGIFYTPELEAELRAGVCVDCWNEWQRAEVMVINELKLNFMDPGALTVLTGQMREFFALDSPAGGPAAAAPSALPPDVNLKNPATDESE
ncbi:MAG: Fe(2+)-trafficking protein [Acidobacteriota bacterium]|nr:Fe(2+)-trafficking protein [Acidobacteriota bacterium]MDH3525108.1 Fe(2+)-trafficking protein [Acidobacteriota bacterium]